MTPRRLDHDWRCYRIGDPNGAYPIFDATGSRIAPGRWNTAACAVVYASEYYSTAMLEKLVRGSGRIPPNQHFIEITIPHGTSYEVVNIAHVSGWDAERPVAAQRFGDRWKIEQRSAILFVPSVIARVERNILINPDHPEFRQVSHGLETPVWWDSRLFGP